MNALRPLKEFFYTSFEHLIQNLPVCARRYWLSPATNPLPMLVLEPYPTKKTFIHAHFGQLTLIVTGGAPLQFICNNCYYGDSFIPTFLDFSSIDQQSLLALLPQKRICCRCCCNSIFCSILARFLSFTKLAVHDFIYTKKQMIY